jgi:hypothetical protein
LDAAKGQRPKPITFLMRSSPIASSGERQSRLHLLGDYLDRRVPRPKQINSRLVWERKAVEWALANLKEVGQEIGDADRWARFEARCENRCAYVVTDMDRHGDLRVYLRMPGRQKVRLHRTLRNGREGLAQDRTSVSCAMRRPRSIDGFPFGSLAIAPGSSNATRMSVGQMRVGRCAS